MANLRAWEIRKFRKSWAGECVEFLGFFLIQTYKPHNTMIEKGKNFLSKQVWLQGSRAQSSTKVKGEWILLSAIKIHKPVTVCALCHFPPSILCSCVYFVLCPYQIHSNLSQHYRQQTCRGTGMATGRHPWLHGSGQGYRSLESFTFQQQRATLKSTSIVPSQEHHS